jgi:hypothetical protein
MSGSVEIFPGKVFGNNENVTRVGLNQLGAPTARIGEGEVGDRELDPDSVIAISARNGLPNFLINGNFDIWQRGGYVNLVGLPTDFGATADAEYTADRWLATTPGATLTRAITQGVFDLDQTDVPNSPTYYLHWEQTTGDTSPTLEQRIESVRTLAGKTVTVSGWVRSNTSGTLSIGFYQHFGGVLVGPPAPGQIRTITPQTFVVTGGAAWVQFELTFDIPSLTGYVITGVRDCLALTIAMPSAATFETDFAQIKVEQAAQATAHDGTVTALGELERCKRYFEYHGGIAASTLATSKPCYYFDVSKYRAPTLAVLSGYSGTGMAFTALSEWGYYQSTANSVVSAFYITADAEIY